MTEQREIGRPPRAATKTEGAFKAGNGRYTFDLARLQTLDAGPGYSSAHGPVVEGERIQIGLMRMQRGPAGDRTAIRTSSGSTSSRARSNARSRGQVAGASGHSHLHAANAVHWALATAEEDVVFLTAKDMSHGIVGTPVDTSISTPLYATGVRAEEVG